MVDIDVVIPTFGRPATVTNTLRMLLEQETLPKRVIVVNQTPGVETADPEVWEAYREVGPELVWINRVTPSLCGARNDALRAASAEICLFLDDDIIAPPDLVAKHWSRYQERGGWAAVGGQVWHRPLDCALECVSLDDPSSGTIAALESRERIHQGPLIGCHFSMRRNVALAVGGWDEAFVGSANWEEGDIINRLKAGGYPFMWDPEIWLIHLRLPTGGCRIPGNRSFLEWTKSTNFFLYKYRYPRDKRWKEVLSTALRAGPLRKEIVVNPWRWPSAWFGFLKGWAVGRERAGNPILPIREMSLVNGRCALPEER